MRISEIRAREKLDDILPATLAAAWSRQLGTPLRVEPDRGQPGQRWRIHELLSLYTSEATTRATRRWIADSFRYTPRRLRAPAQWLLGTAAASRTGLRLAARRALVVSPAVPDAEHLVLVPGNRRLRLLDLATGRTLTMVKHGFDPTPLRREAQLRQTHRDGPFLPVLEHVDADPVHWLEEPLVDGWSLPRCPPGIDRRRAERLALERLARWLDDTTEPVAAATHAEALASALAPQLDRIDARFASVLAPRLAPQIDGLVQLAAALGDVSTALSHGDLQMGNVMLRRRGARRPAPEDIVLIDWEYTARRFAPYDALCHGLGARARDGLAERIGHFVAEGPAVLGAGALAAMLPAEAAHSAAWRAGACAFFLLEDLLWLVTDAAEAPFTGIPAPLATMVRELERFGPRMQALAPRQRAETTYQDRATT